METLVLVLTDVQGSTRLWQDEPVAMDAAMARHHEIVHTAVTAHGGWRPVDQGEGDAVFAAFRSPTEAVAAVVRMQRELAAEQWPTSGPLRVRIGVHLGEVTERGGNLFGDPVNRCARLRGLGSGGQTLLSSAVYEVVRDRLPDGTSLSDLGEHRMKDLVRPERVWQLDIGELLTAFGPLASLDAALHNLPVQRSALIGRDDDLRKVVRLIGEHRLVTLTGFGGMGKTRLSLQVAAELVDDFPDGVWFVDLAELTDPAHTPAAVARAAGLKVVDGPAVCEALARTRTLLVLDNLEQVLGMAPFISALLDAAAGVRVLATSRAPLRVRGEHEVALSPLALPPQDGSQDAATVSAFAAVQLFIDRACAVREDFAVTNDNAPAVAAICQRLDGHPLAIELAAARVKMMTPQSLLPRLDKALSVLTGGSRDMPDRHQTLRGTIAWSYDNLTADEQQLLQRMAVLPTDADLTAIEAVCGDGLDVFDLLASLVDNSLVRVLPTDSEDRYGLLLSIRAYATEHTTPELIGQVQARHHDWYTGLFRPTPPISRAEFLRLTSLMIVELDHVAAAWEFAQSDPASVRDFPTRFGVCLLYAVGDLPRGVAVLEQIVSNSGRPTIELFKALDELVLGARELGAVIGPQHRKAMHSTAQALSRPDVDLLMAEVDYDALAHGDEEGIRALLEHMQQLLPQVPADSPFCADLLHDLVDNLTCGWLWEIDPEEALAAARLNETSKSMGVLGEANLAKALALVGRDAEALRRFADQVETGPPRHERAIALLLAQAVACSAVTCGDSKRALTMLGLWREYLAGQPFGAGMLAIRIEAYALLELGETERAREVLNTIPELHAGPGISLMFHRLERLANGSTSTEQVDASLSAWRARAPDDRLRGTYLSLLVERALREPDATLRIDLAKQAEQERGPISIPWGYQADLDRLLAPV